MGPLRSLIVLYHDDHTFTQAGTDPNLHPNHLYVINTKKSLGYYTH